jgi:hypothetical protein
MPASVAEHLLHLLARQDPDSSSTGSGTDAPDGGDAATVDACAATNYTDRWGLRIGAIFVILVSCLPHALQPTPRQCQSATRTARGPRESQAHTQVTSLLGTLAPIILRRVSVIPRSVWE